MTFAKRGREFVLSQTALESEAKLQREEALKNIKIGEVVRGIVRSIQPFGCFVDIGGVDGLVPIAEASHTNAPLSEVFQVGQEVDVKILRVDEKNKIWLSKRAAEQDPWDGADQRFPRGSVHKAKVVRLQPFGAFIELEPGIDGLLHVSDIPSPKRLSHPNEVLKVGDDIEVWSSKSTPKSRKLGLHVAPKEGERNERAQRLALHQSVKVAVEGYDLNGLIVRILGQTGRNAKGFIPAQATGTAKGTDLRKAFQSTKRSKRR